MLVVLPMYNPHHNMAIIKRLLKSKGRKPLKKVLVKTNERDISKLFFEIDKSKKDTLIDQLISIGKAGKVLCTLPKPSISELFQTNLSKILKVLNICSEDQASFLVSALSNDFQEQILDELPLARRLRLTQILSYEENTAGRDMQLDTFSLNVDLNVKEAISKIRSHIKEKAIYYIFCVSKDMKLEGVIAIRNLVATSEDTLIKDIMKKDMISVSTNTSSTEVAKLVSKYDLVAIPVLDDEGKFKGVIAVDDIIDIIQDQATKNIYSSAGLKEDDRVYSKPSDSVKNRLPWMVLNLFLAGMVSLVVSFFEETMSKLIILATLNNIVVGSSGNMGVQTLTIVTRGLATGDFDFITYKKAMVKEIKVGLILGLVTGILAGFVVYFWKSHLAVSIIICVSLILNSAVASVLGFLIPIFLKKKKWDPASGSGVLVTTITDCFGFFSFLGIAALTMKYFDIY